LIRLVNSLYSNHGAMAVCEQTAVDWLQNIACNSRAS